MPHEDKKSKFVEFPPLSGSEQEAAKLRFTESIDVLMKDVLGLNAGSPEAVAKKRDMVRLFERMREVDRYREQLHHPLYSDIRQVLDHLNLPGAVRVAVDSVYDQTHPLLRETYRPGLLPKEAGEIAAEGRGVYRTASVKYGDNSPGENPVIVYIKGGGDKRLLSLSSRAPFAAFPSDSRRLFFDDMTDISSDGARIMGTQGISWGVVEQVNLSVLLAAATKRFSIRTPANLESSKLPIPIGLEEHPDLTLYIHSLIAQRAAKTTHTIERQRLISPDSWERYVSVGAVVPETTRGVRMTDLDFLPKEKRRGLLLKLSDPERARFLGKIFTTQIELGLIFSGASAHGQNIYESPESVLPLADYADLVFLGSLKSLHTKAIDPPVLLTAEERQTYVLYQYLARLDGLRPLHSPLSEQRIAYSRVFEANRNFWNQVVSPLSLATSDDHLALASMYLPSYFEYAIAKLTRERLSRNTRDQWNLSAETQRKALAVVSPSGEIQSAVESGNRYDVNDHSVLGMRDMSSSGRMKNITNLLTTGDIEPLLKDSRLGIVVQLGLMIHGVSDETLRSRLAEKLITIQRTRDYAWMEEYPLHLDLISVFENKHLEKVQAFLKDGKYDYALQLLDGIENWQKLRYADESEIHPEDNNVDKKMYYGMRLLEAKPAEYKGLVEEMKHFALLGEMFSSVAGNVFFSAFANDGLDVFRMVREKEYTHPRTLFIQVLGMYYKSPQIRGMFEAFARKSQEIIESHSGDTQVPVQTILAELDELAGEMPQLSLIPLMQHMRALQALRREHPQEARERMELVIKEYGAVEGLGISERTGWKPLGAKVTEMAQDWDREKLRRADYLEKRGYAGVAKYYRDGVTQSRGFRSR